MSEPRALRILCVCTGNTCRSPMLAALLRERLHREGIAAQVSSAGIAAGHGQTASPHAQTCMQERGLSLKSHFSRPLQDEDLHLYDAIWCLGPGHAQALIDTGVDGSLLRVVNADAGGVPDPFGGDLASYQDCAAVLEDALDTIIADCQQLRSHL